MWRVSEPNLLKNNNKCLLIVIDLRNLAVLHGATYNFKPLKKMCIILFCQAFRPAKLFAQKWKEAYTHYLFTLEVTGYPIYVLHIYSTILLKKGHCFRKFGLCYDRFLNHKLRVCWEIFCSADFCYPYKSTIQQLV